MFITSSNSSFRRGHPSLLITLPIFLLLASCLLQLSAAKNDPKTSDSKNEEAVPLAQQDTSKGGTGSAEDSSLSAETGQNKNQTKTVEEASQSSDVASVDGKNDDVKGQNDSSSAEDEKTKNETADEAEKSGEKSEGENKEKADDEENDFKKTIKKFSDMLSDNKSAVQNMMFALIGLTSLVVLYFIIKTMRLRQKKSKNRKYGVLTNGMEMDHLESDSDDEDTTVFEINHRRQLIMLRTLTSQMPDLCSYCTRPAARFKSVYSRSNVNKMFSVSMSSYIKRPPRPRSPLSVVPPPSLEADEMQFDWRTQVENQFIYGVHPCLLALKHKSRYVHRAFVRKDYFQTKKTHVQNPSKMLQGVRQILEILENERIPVMLYNRAALQFMAQDKPHQGIVLEVSGREITDIPNFDEQTDAQTREEILSRFANEQHLIVLDQIRDPMNLGAVIRTSCFLMGPDKSVILTPQTSVLSPACTKASSGAVELTNFFRALKPTSLLKLLKQEQGRLIIGTDEPSSESVSLDHLSNVLSGNPGQKTVLVFGFEGSGVSKELLQVCDKTVSILPFSSHNYSTEDVGINSLNVSAAFSIVLYQLLQQCPT